MKKRLLILTLIGVILISGCIKQEEEDIPEDEALRMEFEVTEEKEEKKILPGQPIRMVVYLRNQVENDTTNVDITISDPHGVKITKVNCGFDCICSEAKGWSNQKNGISCYYNGCHFNTIQSFDKIEIIFSLKVPTEEELSWIGRKLEPEFTLEYNYAGVSMRYVPILKMGERISEKSSEFGQTYGPIHVDIETEEWIREGDVLPVYVNVKDVVNPRSEIEIRNDSFRLFLNRYLSRSKTWERCDFIPVNDTSFEYCNISDSCYGPEENITLPLENPLVCALEANDTDFPMVRGLIGAEYKYRYEIVETKTIEVETEIFD